MFFDEPETFSDYLNVYSDEELAFSGGEQINTFTGIEFGLFPSSENTGHKTEDFTEFTGGTGALLTYKTGTGTLDGNDLLMGALSLGPLAAGRLTIQKSKLNS